MGPSWYQNRIRKRSHVKIACKPKNIIFPIDLNDFSKFGNRFSEGKSNKRRLKNCIQDRMPPFESPLPRKLGPGRPQAAPRLPKTTRRRPQDGPKMASRRPKTAPRHRQGGSKTASSRPRTSQDGPRHPKTAPRRPKTSPRRPWTTFLADFWMIFGRFLDNVLDYFCNDFAPTCYMTRFLNDVLGHFL